MEKSRCFRILSFFLLTVFLFSRAPVSPADQPDAVSRLRRAENVQWAGGRFALLDGVLTDLETGAELLTGAGQIARAGNSLYVGGPDRVYLLDETASLTPAGTFLGEETWLVSASGWLVRYAERSFGTGLLVVHDLSGAVAVTASVESVFLEQDFLTWTTTDEKTWVWNLAADAVFELPYSHLELESDGDTFWATDDGCTPLYRLDDRITEVIPEGWSLWGNHRGLHVEAGQVRGNTVGEDGEQLPDIVVFSTDTGEMLLSMEAKWIGVAPDLYYSMRDEYAPVELPGERYAVISVRTGEILTESEEYIWIRSAPGSPYVISSGIGPDEKLFLPETGETWLVFGEETGYTNVRTGEKTELLPAADPVLRELSGTYPDVRKTSDGYYVTDSVHQRCQLLFGQDGEPLTDQQFVCLPPHDFNEPVFSETSCGIGYFHVTKDEDGRITGSGGCPAHLIPSETIVFRGYPDEKEGVLRRDGALLLPAVFDRVLRAGNGQGYIARKDGQWYLYDPDGNLAY